MKNSSHTLSLKKPAALISILMSLAFILVACQPAAAPSAAPTDTTAPTATSAPTQAATATSNIPSTGGTAGPSEAAINVATDPKLGKILVDGNGMTLYAFTKDGPNQSNCSGKCLENWPALMTMGTPKLGDGVDASLIGTAPLPGGSMIVTYNKMPLYTFIKDKQAGDVAGQGVGEVWFVVSPDGQAVQTSSNETSTTATPAATTAAGGEATINVATDAKLGKILVDGNGMTLYMFTKDGPSQSTCTGKCLQNWPALKTMGHPTLGEGVDASLIGTATLADGTMIVTYNKMPLYTYIKDAKAGDVLGQGVGNVWYVVAPDGKAVGYMQP
jgi:predicted lipoprotein with Yx(FWY)xxD motif